MTTHGLLARNMQCQRCGGPTEERMYTCVTDGVTWRCSAQQRIMTTSIRTGIFFQKSHLPLQKKLDLLYYWSIQDMQFHVGVDEKTVTDWYNSAHDICSKELINNALHIGTAGHTVAIDESVVTRTNLATFIPDQCHPSGYSATLTYGRVSSSWNWSHSTCSP